MKKAIAAALATAALLAPLGEAGPVRVNLFTLNAKVTRLEAKVETLRERVTLLEVELRSEREIRQARDYQLATCFLRKPNRERKACFETFVEWYAPENPPDVP